jgi:autotransporter translocation and assembly factor TamB
MLAEDPDTMETPGQIIGPSRDVVVVNAPEEAIESARQPAAPFRIDNQIQLILGDRVKVNTLGFISRITGAVTFTNRPDQRELIPMANGRLSVEDGTFRAFGQDLDIETGQLIFADVPATEPELNVRAVRWIDNDPQVTAAGVLITGSVTEPTLELFSRPQLEASEVQSYLLTGRSSADKDDVLSIGTYLNPRTYLGYGYNLLEKTSEFNSLFSITPRYGIGANLGEADNNINLTFTYEK